MIRLESDKNEIDGVVIKVYADTLESFDLEELALSAGLLNEKRLVYLYDCLSDEKSWNIIAPSLENIENSEHVFIFSDVKMVAAAKKGISKYIKDLPKTKMTAQEDKSVFTLADAIAKRDKKDAWKRYTELKEKIPFEEIHGVIVWNIKTMLMIKKFGKNPSINPFVYKKNKPLADAEDMVKLEQEYRDLLIMRNLRETHTDLSRKLEKFILDR